MTAASPAYVEVVNFLVSHTSSEPLLQFRPSETNQRRVADLIERQHQGVLSVEESSELDDYVQLEHLLIMAKAEARLRLQFAVGH